MEAFVPEFTSAKVSSPQKLDKEPYVVIVEAMGLPREKNSSNGPMPRWLGFEAIATPLLRKIEHPEFVMVSSQETDDLVPSFRRDVSECLVNSKSSSHVVIVAYFKPVPYQEGSPKKSKYGKEIKILRLQKEQRKPLARLANKEEAALVFKCMPVDYINMVFKKVGNADPFRWNPIFVNTILTYGFYCQ